MTTMFRLATVIVTLSFGFVVGGWYGLLYMALVVGFIGAVVGPPKLTGDDPTPMQEWEWEKVDRARRGESADPTRPDDHPLLLTHEIKRRR
jgi:hypothetical protein